MFCQKCGSEIAAGGSACVKCGVSTENVKRISTSGRRLVNYIIDTFVSRILTVFILVSFWGLLNIAAGTSGVDKASGAIGVFNLILPLLIALASIFSVPIYYIFFEAIWQRTPGKWATGTKVVMRDGSKPRFWRVVGRSFARIIPFEPFSFLLSGNPYGWHDSLTGTMVVDQKYTVDEIKTIDPKNKGEFRGLVVGIIICAVFFIPIIGILSSVVLASLNTARAKGNEASAKANMINLIPQAELYFDTNSSYVGFCKEAITIHNLTDSLKAAPAGADYACNDSEKEWAASVPFKTENYACVDNGSVISVKMRTSDLGSATSCVSTEDSTGSVAAPSTITSDSVPWITYTAPTDGFSVSLPQEPKVSYKKDMPSDDGTTYDASSYSTDDNSRTFLVKKVTYANDFPVEDIDSVLKFFVDSLVSKNSSLVSSSYSRYNNIPSADFLLKIGDEMLKGRYLISGNVVYFLAMDYFPEQYSDTKYKAFVNSLKIKP